MKIIFQYIKLLEYMKIYLIYGVFKCGEKLPPVREKDIIRDNAKSVIKELKSIKKEVIMLSGDNETTAKLIAKELDMIK